MNFPDALTLRRELLRRGVALERRGEKLVCLPKGGAGELLPEVARFKPSLLELLELERAEVLGAARTRLALDSRRKAGGAPANWRELRPICGVAARATGREIKPEELLDWARGVLESEGEAA